MENNQNESNLNKMTNQRLIIIIIFITAITAGLLFLVTTLYRNQENTINSNMDSTLNQVPDDYDPYNPEGTTGTGQSNSAVENSTPEIIIDDNNFDQELDNMVEDIESLDTEIGNDQDLSDEMMGI